MCNIEVYFEVSSKYLGIEVSCLSRYISRYLVHRNCSESARKRGSRTAGQDPVINLPLRYLVPPEHGV